MHVGFEYPQRLLIALPVVCMCIFFLFRGERSYLIDPWAAHIAVRLRMQPYLYRLPYVLLCAAALLMVVVWAEPWKGTEEHSKKEKARQFGVITDASGSMTGDPLKAATLAARYLIEKRPDDRVNMTFFASEANATLFGIPASYLTEERVNRLAEQLGGSTVAPVGLFVEFVAIARQDNVFTEKELEELAVRAQMPTGSSYERIDRMRADYQESFRTYLAALLEERRPPKADRLMLFISDCDLSYTGYDTVSVLELYRRLDIRVEVVCITQPSAVPLGNTYQDNGRFVDGVRARGGEIRNFPVEQMLRVADAPPPKFIELLNGIESLKPREVENVLTIKKHPVAKEFILAALGLLGASMLLAACIPRCHVYG